MPNHFSSIGFVVNEQADMTRLFEKLVEDGVELDTAHGAYVAWKLEPGVELWANTTSQRQLSGCNPHFTGSGRVQVTVNSLVCPDQEWPLEGALMGSLASADAEGGPPIVVDLPAFDLVVAGAAPGSTRTVQVAAFAHELRCFADEASYSASQTSNLKYAPNFYVPTGTFTSDPNSQPRAEAMFAGTVEQCRVVTNPYSQRTFHHIVIASLPGTLDIVADPEIVQGQPAVGGIVSGSFWLSGHLLGD